MTYCCRIFFAIINLKINLFKKNIKKIVIMILEKFAEQEKFFVALALNERKILKNTGGQK